MTANASWRYSIEIASDLIPTKVKRKLSLEAARSTVTTECQVE